MTLPVAAKLAPLAAHLTSLDLGGLAINDADACEGAAALPGLQRLALWGTRVGDACLPALAALSALSSLDLSWSGVKSLPLLPQLHVLQLGACELEETLVAAPAGYEGAAGQLPLRELHLPRSSLAPVAAELACDMIR